MTVRVVDGAGNASGQTATAKVYIDPAPPNVPGVTLSTEQWTNSTVTVAIKDNGDAHSGVARTEYSLDGGSWTAYSGVCALPGFVDSKNEEKTERNAGYLVVSHSGGGMLRQGTRKGIRRTPANRGMRAHWVVKGLDISEDVCHGMCP